MTTDLCVDCDERPKAKNRNRCYRCEYYRHRERKLADKSRLRAKQYRQCVEGYGGKCVDCGESDVEVLTLDHINGDGATHRASVGNDKIYRDLIARGFPPVVEVRCANCHLRRTRRQRWGKNERFGSTGR